MMKNRKGITLTALVVTIILMILIAAIAITLSVGENGLFSKAKSTSYNQAVGELYDRAYGFKTFYEIKDGKIWDKTRKIELAKKEEFENIIRDKFKQEGKESSKPVINPITNEDTRISGSGERGATIYVNIGGTQYTAKVDENGRWSVDIPVQKADTKITVIQKEKDKIVSVETVVGVVKAKLEQVTIDEVLNTNTSITGSARPGADITMVIGSTEYTGKADSSRKIYYTSRRTV